MIPQLQAGGRDDLAARYSVELEALQTEDDNWRGTDSETTTHQKIKALDDLESNVIKLRGLTPPGTRPRGLAHRCTEDAVIIAHLRAWLQGGLRFEYPYEIPDQPCSDEDPHAWHFWSDGIMGFECPGVHDCPDCGETPCHRACVSGGGLT